MARRETVQLFEYITPVCVLMLFYCKLSILKSNHSASVSRLTE